MIKFLNKVFKKNVFMKKSYSQCGEDLIIDFIFSALGIKDPVYLDLGANHYMYLNNTYHFYEKGSRGVLVEPDPELYNDLKKKRNFDVCLNVGVGLNKEENADFYILTSKTLNTFSKEEAERYCSYGQQKIEKIIQIPLLSVNKIIEENFKSSPNFVSIDVEGLDYEIIQSWDFEKYRPEVICVETITYTEDRNEKKIQEIIDYMVAENYFIYADTYINTIFVDQSVWEKRI
jgi:FkbM family methyltransferase